MRAGTLTAQPIRLAASFLQLDAREKNVWVWVRVRVRACVQTWVDETGHALAHAHKVTNGTENWHQEESGNS